MHVMLSPDEVINNGTLNQPDPMTNSEDQTTAVAPTATTDTSSPVKTVEKAEDEKDVSPLKELVKETSPAPVQENGNLEAGSGDEADKEAATPNDVDAAEQLSPKPEEEVMETEDKPTSPGEKEADEVVEDDDVTASEEVEPSVPSPPITNVTATSDEADGTTAPSAADEDQMDTTSTAEDAAPSTTAAVTASSPTPPPAADVTTTPPVTPSSPVKASPKKSPVKAKESPRKESPRKESPRKESPRKESPRKAKQPAAETSPSKTASPAAAATTPKTAQPPPVEDKTPLLQAPLVVEGKRQRRTIDRLEIATSTSAKKTGAEMPEGSGTKLGDIEYVEAMIVKTKADDLKPLHKLLLGRLGTSHEIKKNIRQFCGFNDAGVLEKKKSQLSSKSWVQKDLASLCRLCGVERGGTKEEVVERVAAFLAKPYDTGAKLADSKKSALKKRKRSSGATKKTASSKKKPRTSKGTVKEDEDEEGEEEEGSKSEGDSEGGEEEAEKSDDEKEDEEDEPATPPPSKKSKPAPKEKKTPAPKEKKTPAKTKTPGKTNKTSEKKPKAPTNDDLTAAIKEILEGANLEEVTMKEMCKKVYGKFPSEDLSAKKDYIKNTVKKMISESA